MVVALEYLAVYDDVFQAQGALETTNELIPEKGWLRSFNLGSRRTIVVGENNGCIGSVIGCVGDVLRQYYLTNLEPMPADVFYSTVKALLTFHGIRFVEKACGTRNVMYVSDEVFGLA